MKWGDTSTYIAAGQCISVKSFEKLNQLGEGSAYSTFFAEAEQ